METDEQLAILERKYEVLKTKINDLQNLKKPEEKRKVYESYWNMIEDRESFIKEDQEYINKNKVAIQKEQESLQKQQELIDKINKLYDEMKEELNEKQKGMLQGLALQTIKKNNIIPDEGNVIAKNVLEQYEDYDEAEDIERNRNNNIIGGKKRRIKNKTHKKRKNKNKKSRRFIRNK